MKSSEAPQNDASGSDQPQKDQQKSSVFDFLYHDARRVSSFLAQFSDYGHLLSVKATEATGQASTKRFDTSVSGALPIVANAKGEWQQSTTDDERDSAERTFDPIWANALNLLAFLSERELIERDITAARIGQFILVSGRLDLIDLGIFRAAWENAKVKEVIVHGAAVAANVAPKNRNERRRAEKQKPTAATEAELAVEMMAMMPHSAIAAVSSGPHAAWCVLRDEWLTVPAADILLKHGVNVAGEWSMLGILDAMPDQPNIEIEPGIFSRNIDYFISGMKLSQMAMHFAGFAGPARLLLGRPEESYGITPLLIFRQVS
ncbi:hypothetical protein [Methylocystis iwaonis]|uniref:Uncharacterized protein n=1 Tax=Methylocystis iwaonis TaxID=2885079 RepID=A0ABM8E9L9_9HYPH|nr:hypothetical protein [Methylocystis iwaonis]BDV34675.1 hypothetical protein SS37A_22040 [Methylocystis iwaonis]